MLKLHVNFILQAQNQHKRPSEVLVLQYIEHTVHHPWHEHKPVLCHFQLHTPRSKCRFFSMWSHSVQQQKFSAQPSVLGLHEQKRLARIPVAPSGTLQLPLEQVNYQLNNSSLSKNPFSSASR